MRNVWLILRREYLERVRTKSFLISTLLFPLFIVGIMVLPAKLATMKSSAAQRLVIVASRPEFAERVRNELMRPDESDSRFTVESVLAPDESQAAAVRRRLSAGEIDGYIWAPDGMLQSGTVTYYTRGAAEFTGLRQVDSAIERAAVWDKLSALGLPTADAEQVMKGVQLETVTVKGGKESKTGLAQFFSVFILVMMLYITLLLYGMSVMRSVLEEKSSRVVEVLLSSATAKELMTGKLVGVAAVGLTQILAWALLGAIFVLPSLAIARETMGEVSLPLAALPAFAVFFLLGYLLYSSLFAALGAMVNNEQEAQQWQFFVTLPIIVPIVLMQFVLRQPDSPASFWLSQVPFFSPILMYLRIVVGTPPFWQIALSVAVLLATTYAVLSLCSRIYRVGILMYGKKPTLPEIVKWVRYA